MKKKRRKKESDILKEVILLGQKKRKVGRPRKVRTPKKVGRKRIKREFSETKVGHYLKHEAPLEYELILDASGASSAPTADLIEAIGYASINLLFRKPKFRVALIEYRKYGLYSGEPVRDVEGTVGFYEKLRKNNARRAMALMRKQKKKSDAKYHSDNL